MTKGNWELYFDAVKNQDWKAAKDILQQMALKERDNPQTFLKFGDICQRTGEKKEAISAYLRAAQILRTQGFAQKALATYKIALRLDPGNQEIVRLAELMLDEFETVRTSPRIPPSVPAAEAGPAVSLPAGNAVLPSPESPPAKDWLETTAVSSPAGNEDIPSDIQPTEWLEMTSLTGGTPDKNRPEPERAAADKGPHSRDTEEDADWLEAAYEAVDTRMFSLATQQTGQNAPDLTSEEISASLKEFHTPLSERRDAGIPGVLSDLPQQIAGSFMDELSVLSFKDSQYVIEEGDSGDSMYVIRSGRAKVVAHLLGKRVELAVLGEGDLFGEVGFLTGRTRTASVIAMGPLQLYEVTRLNIERLIETSPDIMAKLEGFYEMRVRDTISKIKS